MWLLMQRILKFIRFGGRRALARTGLRPIFKVEGVKQGKLDNGDSSAAAGISASVRGSGSKVAPAS